MTYYEGEQDPSFNWHALVNVSGQSAVLKSNTALTVTYVQSRMRNAGLTSEQIQAQLGITDDEVRACVDAFDAGYR